jgi:Prp8 binding protein
VPETLQLTGHKAAVYALEFAPNGSYMASGGFDRQILIWKMETKPQNVGKSLQDHKNAILGLKFMSDETQLLSCGAQG